MLEAKEKILITFGDKTDTVELLNHPPSSLNSSSLAEDDLNPAAAAGGRQEVTSSFALRYTLHIPNSLFEVAKSRTYFKAAIG